MSQPREPYTPPADPEVVSTAKAAAFTYVGVGGDLSVFASVT